MKRILSNLTLLTLLPMSLFANKALDIGAVAPAPPVVTHLGEPLDLAALYARGPVLIYFYPKADTPGCTAQACNLRDNFSALQAAGVTVVGVSTDSVKSQRAFKEKYELPFILVADEDRTLGRAFGVGTLMGMAYKRQTFLVVDGKIAWRDLNASPSTQSADALAALHALKSGE